MTSSSPVDRLLADGSPFAIVRGHDGRMAFKAPPHDLSDLFNRASRWNGRPFLIHGPRVIGFAEVFARAAALSGRLTYQHGAIPGDRVVIGCTDVVDWIVAFAALTGVGLVAVLATPETRSSGVQAHAGARLACVGQADLEIPAMPCCRLTDEMADPAATFATGLRDRIAAIAFTSGSSGAPKAVAHSHSSMVSALRTMMLGGALRALAAPRVHRSGRSGTPKTLMLAPPFHVGGYSQLLLAMLTGSTVVAPARTQSIDDLVALARHHEVNAVTGASEHILRAMLGLPDAAAALGAVERLFVHGSAIRSGFAAWINAVLPGVELATGYGMTELGGAVTFADVREFAGRKGAVGHLVPVAEARVVDETGQAVPPGHSGDLHLRGPMLMAGYYAASELRGIDPDGWFDTGDRARLDMNGALFIDERIAVGRAEADVLAAVVEEFLLRECDVIDVCVLSRGRAAIVPRAGCDLRAPAVELLLTQHFPCHWQVRIETDLPRTSSGKLNRRIIEETWFEMRD